MWHYRGEERSIQGSDGENEGRRIRGRPKRRWEHNIKLGKAIPLQTLTGPGVPGGSGSQIS